MRTNIRAGMGLWSRLEVFPAARSAGKVTAEMLTVSRFRDSNAAEPGARPARVKGQTSKIQDARSKIKDPASLSPSEEF